MARPSMAIIVTFVGRAPLWLPAFLLSCRHNQDVRWLIYSDMRITLAVPANVTLRRLSLDALSRRASEGHCQVADERAFFSLGAERPSLGQPAHVTSSH